VTILPSGSGVEEDFSLSSSTLSSFTGSTSVEQYFAFYTRDRSVFWIELSAKGSGGMAGTSQLAKINFSSFPTCLDINKLTASQDRIDTIVGFQSGDIIWFGW
jgi:catabolite repression protein CreC